MSDRVKQIIQNNSGSYSTPIPIGSQGQYIDMLSGLDLEEELRLGGNHSIEIQSVETQQQNINNTVIFEQYGKKYKEITHISQNKNNNITTISSSLYNISPNLLEDELLHIKNVQINNGYFILERLDNNNTTRLLNTKWRINPQPTLPNNSMFYNLHFVSNEKTFTGIILSSDMSSYKGNPSQIVCMSLNNYIWSEEYREIVILGGDDVDNSTLEQWLNQNAIQI